MIRTEMHMFLESFQDLSRNGRTWIDCCQLYLLHAKQIFVCASCPLICMFGVCTCLCSGLACLRVHMFVQRARVFCVCTYLCSVRACLRVHMFVQRARMIVLWILFIRDPLSYLCQCFDKYEFFISLNKPFYFYLDDKSKIKLQHEDVCLLNRMFLPLLR